MKKLEDYKKEYKNNTEPTLTRVAFYLLIVVLLIYIIAGRFYEGFFEKNKTEFIFYGTLFVILTVNKIIMKLERIDIKNTVLQLYKIDIEEEIKKEKEE